MRYCICGKSIAQRRQLCKECLEIYGENPNEQPEWVRWQIADIQRELDYDRNHDHINILAADVKSCKPAFVLRGCRTETHLYQDRDKY